MFRKSTLALLGLLYFGQQPVFAQPLAQPLAAVVPTTHQTFNGFGAAERATLNDQQAAAFLEAVNHINCPCGCAKGTVAECRHVDPGCGVSMGLVNRALAIIKAEPTLDGATLTARMQAELAAQVQARQKAMADAQRAEEERARKIHVVPLGDSAWKGVQHAKVTIVAFSEFQCPFCARVSPTLDQLLENYPNDVKVVFKHYIVHESAIPASVAALEAQAQGKFWEMHDLLFANMRMQTRENLEKWAQDLGMDVARLRTALDSGTYNARLDADQKLGQQLGVNSTPTLFVNGHMVLGAQPYEVFRARVEEERFKAQKLLEAGVPPERLYDELTKPQAAQPAAPVAPPQPEAQPPVAPQPEAAQPGAPQPAAPQPAAPQPEAQPPVAPQPEVAPQQPEAASQPQAQPAPLPETPQQQPVAPPQPEAQPAPAITPVP